MEEGGRRARGMEREWKGTKETEETKGDEGDIK
jgi:hypothetical protein